MTYTRVPGRGQPDLAHRWRRRINAVVGVLVIAVPAAVATGPTAAVAALPTLSAITYVQNHQGPNSFDKGAFVECPDNQVIVGGSAIVSTTTGTIARLSGYVAGTTGNHGFLTVQAEEDDIGSPGNWDLFVTAACAVIPPGYEIVQAGTTFASDPSQTVTAKCPTNKKLLAGFGIVQTGFNNVVLDDMQPSMDLTSVTVKAFEDENGYAFTWNLFATAVCANPVAGLTQRFQGSTTDSNPKPFTVARCPAGTRAISYGATIDSGFGQVQPVGSFVDSNTGQFLAFEDRTGYTSNWSQTTYVTCVT